jgi:hypothetical protein
MLLSARNPTKNVGASRTTQCCSSETKSERPTLRSGVAFVPGTPTQNVGAGRTTKFISSELRKTQNHPVGGFGFSCARNRTPHSKKFRKWGFRPVDFIAGTQLASRPFE